MRRTPNKNRESWNPYLAPDSSTIAFSHFLFSKATSIYLWYIVFLMSKYVPSLSMFFGTFIIKESWDLLKILWKFRLSCASCLMIFLSALLCSTFAYVEPGWHFGEVGSTSWGFSLKMTRFRRYRYQCLMKNLKIARSRAAQRNTFT